MNMLPTIVIVGRRNVGKSALFNRLIEEEKAIVSDIAGTTRDRTEGICLWRGTKIRVVDTGGLDIGSENIIDREVTRQANFAMREADLIVFLVDARVDPQSADKQLASKLRQLVSPPARRKVAWRPCRFTRGGASPPATARHERAGGGGSTQTTPAVLLVANKAETAHLRGEAQNPKWKNLGFDIPLPISAITGQGVGDLLDEIFNQLKLRVTSYEGESDQVTTTSDLDTRSRPDLRISIIGKPNVGKSSLLNKILGEERVIVSPTAHTTREPQDTLLSYKLHATCYMLLLIDTAGIRRKARITPGIEQAGVRKTLNVIEKSDVVLFLIDGTQPLDSQDKRLAGMIEEKGVGVVVVVNKWDLLPSPQPSPMRRGRSIATPLPAGEGGRRPGEGRTTKTGDELKKTVHGWLPGLDFAEVVFISALTGHNVEKILSAALSAHAARQRAIPDEELAALLPKLIKRHRPARAKGNTKFPIIRRLTQVATSPPTFVAWIGPKQSLHQTYLRFIENQLRSYFDFEGTPLRVFARQEKK